MSDVSERYALAVDGGGTKTEAWLARCDDPDQPTVLGRARGASSNPRAVGVEPALHNLGVVIGAAFRDAGCAPFPVDIAVLALSGVGHPSMREKFAGWADARRLARRLQFEHDVEPVLAQGTPHGWGVALIVGTGSAAVGVAPNGERRVVGGWGYHYGDEGSAHWLGRRALEAVARSADGRSAATLLTDALLQRLDVRDPRSILGALELTGDVRGAIAGLADAVEQSARQGDPVALNIVEDAVSELTEMIAALVGQLRLGPAFPLAMAGGVICGSDLLCDRLQEAITARGLRPAPITTVPQPIAGCLKIAGRVLRAAVGDAAT